MFGTQAVVEMFRLYIVAKGSMFSDRRIANELAGRRNRAAHAGEVPSYEEAHRALKTAADILAEANPLPEPSQLVESARQAVRRLR